jgi:hypothetical protein
MNHALPGRPRMIGEARLQPKTTPTIYTDTDPRYAAAVKFKSGG